MIRDKQEDTMSAKTIAVLGGGSGGIVCPFKKIG